MGTNQFLSFPVVPAGAEGPQAAIDLFTLVPATGLDPDLTFLGVGNFVGTISIEGSPSAAGDDWSVVAQFESGLDADANVGPVLGFAPIVAEDVVVRRLRLNVRGRIIQPVTITVGAEQNCDCSAGGGTGSFESVTGGSGILVIQSPTGAFTVINLGVITASGGTGIAVTPGATGSIVITNTGVIQVQGTGSIQVSNATGIVTISDLGLFMASAGTGIRINSATGIVQIDNVGVVLATGGTGIAVSNSTGLVRIDNLGVVQLIGTGSIQVSNATGTVTISDRGVNLASGGTGIRLVGTTGTIRIDNVGVVLATGGTGIIVSNSTGLVRIDNVGLNAINGITGFMGIQSPMLTTTLTATGTVLRLDNGNVLSLSLIPTINTLDAARFTSWNINASGAVNVLGPSNPREGEKITFTIIKNTATGAMLFPTGVSGGFQFPSGPLGPLLTDYNSLYEATPSGGFFEVGFEFKGRNSRWVCVALAGFYV